MKLKDLGILPKEILQELFNSGYVRGLNKLPTDKEQSLYVERALRKLGEVEIEMDVKKIIDIIENRFEHRGRGKLYWKVSDVAQAIAVALPTILKGKK